MNTQLTGNAGPNGGIDGSHLKGVSAGTVLEGPAEAAKVSLAVPGYLMADVSFSMEDNLPVLNRELQTLQMRLRANEVASMCWLGLGSFADTACTHLEMSQIASKEVGLPGLTCRGDGTNFHAALTESVAAMRRGLLALKQPADGQTAKVMRPTLYVITDGQHNTGPDWADALALLRTLKWRPNVMVFGVPGADRGSVRRMATEGMAFFIEDGQSVDAMFEAIIKIILHSVVTNSVTAAQAQQQAAAGIPPAAITPSPVSLTDLGVSNTVQALSPVDEID